MNPIYKFELSANGTTQRAYPNYKDDLAIDYALETNQEFYRAKLSGKLTFQSDDYTFIRNKSFDTQFDLVIYISYNAGSTWTQYWAGQFWKTDCQIDEDSQTVVVTPTVNDRYNNVIAGLDKEYNLIDLAPSMQPVHLDKRPMIQVYVPGQKVIGCFLSGMWWEQECEEITDENALVNTYFFALNKTKRIVNVTQGATPAIPDLFYGDPYTGAGATDYTNGAYKFRRYYVSGSGGAAEYFQIIRVSDAQIMWSVGFVNQAPKTYPIELTLQPVENSGALGNIKLYIHDMSVYSRYVTDVETALGLTTYPIPENDIVENNRNYSRVIGYYFPKTIVFSTQLTSTPTKWGIYQPGQYYVMFQNPSGGINESFPIARAAWTQISLWFIFDAFDWLTESYWRKEYRLKDSYPIWSVISVLLNKIAPGIVHAGTTDYSRFLYDTNPITYANQRLFITPKSNLISSGYDQPAQKAPITLKRVLDMLRDCFRCYWFIDEQNKFRIEHITWFMRGGTYSGSPVVGMDLTQETVTRNGKPWAFARNQYQFDKPEMASRYQFGWMDDVTELFDGFPIDIISKYVNPDNIEQIDVSQFTSDVDYILLNPGEISKDGFVLLAATNSTDFSKIAWESGTLMAVTGNTYEQTKQPATNRIRSVDLYERTSEQIQLSLTSGYKVNLTFYDSNLVCLGNSGWITGTGSPTPPTSCAFVGLVVANSSDSEISPGVAISGGIVGLGMTLPYVNFEINYSDHILQNAWAAFIFLQRYYDYDMPARRYSINGVEYYAQGIKKLKTQNIKFPVLTEPNMTNLIKTELGNGTIQKMSVNLSSRNANTTLKYDTE